MPQSILQEVNQVVGDDRKKKTEVRCYASCEILLQTSSFSTAVEENQNRGEPCPQFDEECYTKWKPMPLVGYVRLKSNFRRGLASLRVRVVCQWITSRRFVNKSPLCT